MFLYRMLEKRWFAISGSLDRLQQPLSWRQMQAWTELLGGWRRNCWTTERDIHTPLTSGLSEWQYMWAAQYIIILILSEFIIYLFSKGSSDGRRALSWPKEWLPGCRKIIEKGASEPSSDRVWLERGIFPEIAMEDIESMLDPRTEQSTYYGIHLRVLLDKILINKLRPRWGH